MPTCEVYFVNLKEETTPKPLFTDSTGIDESASSTDSVAAVDTPARDPLLSLLSSTRWSSLQSIEFFDVHQMPATDAVLHEWMHAISQTNHHQTTLYPSLRTIRLNACSFHDRLIQPNDVHDRPKGYCACGTSWLMLLPQCTQLRRLVLDSASLSGASVESLPLLTQLHSLSISNSVINYGQSFNFTRASDVHFERLACIQYLPSLTSVTLDKTPSAQLIYDLHFIMWIPTLRHLTLSDMSASGEWLDILLMIIYGSTYCERRIENAASHMQPENTNLRKFPAGMYSFKQQAGTPAATYWYMHYTQLLEFEALAVQSFPVNRKPFVSQLRSLRMSWLYSRPPPQNIRHTYRANEFIPESAWTHFDSQQCASYHPHLSHIELRHTKQGSINSLESARQFVLALGSLL